MDQAHRYIPSLASSRPARLYGGGDPDFPLGRSQMGDANPFPPLGSVGSHSQVANP
jgi:hypothetical protein